MSNALKDKVVIITGSSMGIGKNTAELFCTQGAKVVLNARNKEKLEITGAEFKKKGYDVLCVAGDISTTEDCKLLIDSCLIHYGRIDILINNAGISMRGPLESLSVDLLKTIYAVNTTGPIELSILALPHLKKSNGSIVFISSLAGFRGLPLLSVYSSSKMSLTAIAQAMRIELKAANVHIGVVHVGIAEIESGKTTLGPHGEAVVLEERKGIFILRKDRVARSILRNVLRRKHRSIPGFIGNLFYFLITYTPNTFEFLLNIAQRRMKNVYK